MNKLTLVLLTARPRQGQLRATLDATAWPAGVYAVRVHAQEGTLVRRLVRE